MQDVEICSQLHERFCSFYDLRSYSNHFFVAQVCVSVCDRDRGGGDGEGKEEECVCKSYRRDSFAVWVSPLCEHCTPCVLSPSPCSHTTERMCVRVCVCASVVKCVSEMYFYCTIYLCLACTPAFTVRLQLITCLCCAVPRGGHGILLLRELLCVGQSSVGPSFAAVAIIVPPTAAW